MKKVISFTCLAVQVFALTSVSARGSVSDYSFGQNNLLGIRFSSHHAVVNNAITYRRHFGNNTAIESLFSFGEPAALGFLLEKYRPLGNSGFSAFLGTGAYFAFAGVRQFGAQGIVGLDLLLPTLPLNFSLDWKPELNVTKQFSFEPKAVGLSARFVF